MHSDGYAISHNNQASNREREIIIRVRLKMEKKNKITTEHSLCSQFTPSEFSHRVREQTEHTSLVFVTHLALLYIPFVEFLMQISLCFVIAHIMLTYTLIVLRCDTTWGKMIMAHAE